MPGEDGKQKIVYSRIGKVVVTGRTPVIMTYNIHINAALLHSMCRDIM